MTLHAETSGQGPLLGMLHGWGLHGGIWGHAAAMLERQFRIVRIDLPGHGHNARTEAGFDLDTAAARVADALPWRCHLLGWSLGATLALRIALDHPERIRRLVLVGATPRFLTGDDWPCAMRPEVLAGFSDRLATDYERTVRDFLALQMRGDSRGAAALRALRAQVFAHGRPSLAALEAGLEVLASTDLRHALARLQTPTLVLSGDRDTLTPADAGRRMAEALPHARLHVFRRTGHAPFLTHAEEFAAEVTAFLGQREGHSDMHLEMRDR